jgi:hypothetical protein
LHSLPSREGPGADRVWARVLEKRKVQHSRIARTSAKGVVFALVVTGMGGVCWHRCGVGQRG